MTWYSPKELVGIEGLPKHQTSISHKAKQENWQSRKRAGKGGGFEYHISSLPTISRIHCQAIQKSIQRNSEVRKRREIQRQDLLKKLSTLPQSSRNEALVKIRIVDAYEEQSELGLSAPKFVRAFNNYQILSDESTRRVISTLKLSNLYRWQSNLANSEIEILANVRRKRNAGKKSLIDRQSMLSEYILSLLYNKPHLSASNITRSAGAYFRDTDVQVPTERNVRIWLEKWKSENSDIFTMLTNPDAFRGMFGVAFGSLSENVERLNQRWELDSTPADLMLSTGSRYQLVGVIDIRSRRFKMRVVEQSNSMEIAALTRRAVIDWGVPEEVKLDNGSDYTSNHMQEVFQSLGIKVSLCPPYSPEMKPHIERVFRTFSHSIVELLPNFVGHNVAERFDLEMQKAFSERLNKRSKFERNTIQLTGITPETLQKICDDWCEMMYMNTKHQGLGCTPNELLASCKDPVRRIRDERVLDLLLLKAPGSRNGRYVVQKKGIRINNAWHISVELGALIGKEVQVLYDPVDLGTVIVRNPETYEYLCTAYDPERVGIDRQDVAIRAKAKQRAKYKEIKEQANRLKRQYKPELAYQEVIKEMRENHNNVVPLPQPSEIYSTPALESMSEAADELAKTLDMHNDRKAEIIENVAFDKTEEQTFENPAIKFRQLIFDSYERPLSKEELEWIDLAREKSWITERWIDICLLEAEAEFDCETPVLHALN